MSNVIDLFTGHPLADDPDPAVVDTVQEFIDSELTNLEYLLGRLAEAETLAEFEDWKQRIRIAVGAW